MPSSSRSDFNGVKAIFERAEQRGEIRTDVKYQVAMQLMIAPCTLILYTKPVDDTPWPPSRLAALPSPRQLSYRGR